ncbi:FAD-dependent oxidoreductase [Leptothrix discophora]|uniref:FAD-dependent oxidoreductase n=1 Tax=Leptothrix discophora TaxID=89 RepID=A0ABT9FY85_LEPDI|nr:FAD-dependent oxidoreductase [Leptothrix discophora]MDP4299200.1 FAD-dependent oxidoreductase [Leptothrix discophora]
MTRPDPDPSPRHIGIAGAGVLGRLAAWALARAGHAVTVFDPAACPGARHDGRGAAGQTAAGMLSPLAELDNAGPEVAELGWRSLDLWHAVAAQLAADPAACAAAARARRTGLALGQPEPATDLPDAPADAFGPIGLRRAGSLLLAHGSDLGAAERVLNRVRAGAGQRAGWPQPQALAREALRTLEPAIDPSLRAWLLPDEGQLVPAMMLAALAGASPGDVTWRWGTNVAAVEPGRLRMADGDVHRCDLALDLRGLGARPESGAMHAERPWTADLRGVRGELVWLHAPGLRLDRPLRLLHPRHRVYIVPRPGERVVIGASEIESEDRSPASLRSAVELMAAAHSVLPALAEARIVHLETNLRPALPDHAPRTDALDGLLRINGLFRHGWLIAPALLHDGLRACGVACALDDLIVEKTDEHA